MTTETQAVKAIVTRALAQGFSCAFDNGDGFEMPQQTVEAIVDGLTGVGESRLNLYRANELGQRKFAGQVYFVFGNSVEELVCDHSDNEATRAVVGPAYA